MPENVELAKQLKIENDLQNGKKLRVEIIFEKPVGLELACTERMPLTLLSFFYF